MAIGTLLVIIAIVLAAVSLLVRRHSWLLAAAVIVGFVGVLLGVGTISVS